MYLIAASITHLKVVIGVLFGLAIGAAIARVVIRLWLRLRFRVDDYLLLCSTACLVAATGVLYYGIPSIFLAAELTFNPGAVLKAGIDESMLLRNVNLYSKINWTYLALSWTTIFLIKFWLLDAVQTVGRPRSTNPQLLGGYIGLAAAKCSATPEVLNKAFAIGIVAIVLDMVTDILSHIDYTRMAAMACSDHVRGPLSRQIDNTWIFMWQQIEACVAVTMLSLTAFRSVFIQAKPSVNRNKAMPWIPSTRRLLGKHKRPKTGEHQRLDDISIPSATSTGLSRVEHLGGAPDVTQAMSLSSSSNDRHEEIQEGTQSGTTAAGRMCLIYMALKDYLFVSVTVLTAFLMVTVSFLVKLYHARVVIAKLRQEGLSMPPWSPIFGHLHFCYKITSRLPRDAHPNYLPDMIRRQLPNLGPIFYLDTWPFGPQMLVVASHHGLYQITQEHSLPKHPGLRSFLLPIAEGLDIVTMEGDLWRKWRGIFNPGFNSTYLMSLAGGIVEETEQFCKNLERLAQNHALFRMKDLTDNLTMDVIGRIAMNVQLNSQTENNPLVNGLRVQVKWLTFGADINPFTRYNPVRPMVHWYNTRRMNKYITRVIDNRFSELNLEGDEAQTASKSIIDLVITSYHSEQSPKGCAVMDETCKKFTMNQIKLFLFSGHDTTSSTVCYIFYVLATHRGVLERVRAEHDIVFGSDIHKAPDLIKEDSHILNQLPFTLAVIKEVLRMYPAVSGTRIGEPGFDVINDTGRRFPTQDFLVWDIGHAIHRDPAYWHRPDDFLPERWLASPGHGSLPAKGAYRPFSHGPRNCIGQELAMIEMKVIMVLVARRFDITLGYDDVDRAKPTRGITTVYGERGYQVQRAQPQGDLPCYVNIVSADKRDAQGDMTSRSANSSIIHLPIYGVYFRLKAYVICRHLAYTANCEASWQMLHGLLAT
ncbi:MAG: hypothetical protein Q9169_008088 [Polycauliona sp. 2 TL-2023]